MQKEMKNIFGMSLQEIEAEFLAAGMQRFRAGQVFDWMYKKNVTSFQSMTNLGQGLRESLAQHYSISHPVIEKSTESADGTKKFLLKTSDGYFIESVLIPAETDEDSKLNKRLTLCISTQVGCPLDCKFCATGSMNMMRNLSAGEIAGQYYGIQAESGEAITNMVYMGMGEPLLNYDAVMASIDLLTDKKGLGISASRITVSTAGIVPGILRMADEKRKVKLAISLHSCDEKTREALMPITRKYGLAEIKSAIDYYYQATRSPITYEYILFDGLNDTDVDLGKLVKLSRRVASKVNIIPFHPINAAYPDGIPMDLKASPESRMEQFAQKLRDDKVTVMFRSSSGKDINAACGQLAVQNSKEKKSTEHDSASI
jgi:23S rRNA (adenine2503-C2)-methyltransferase